MPFAGGIEAPANGTLLLSVAAAFLYLPLIAAVPSWRRTAVKAGSIALLAVLAILQGGPPALIAALASSALGDVFLSRDGDRAFLAGLASFLLAHIAYVVLFLGVGEGLGVITASAWRAGLAIAMAVFAVAMLRRLLAAVPTEMRNPVALYVAAILAMGLAALTMRSPLLAAGAAFFMASDALLAAGRFLLPPTSPLQHVIGPAVWIAYYLAQVVIVLGMLLPG